MPVAISNPSYSPEDARVVADIGLIVLALVALELEIDDLLNLAHSRSRLVIEKIPRFPTRLTCKLNAVVSICEVFQVPYQPCVQSNPLERTRDLRNSLVHGRLTRIAWGKDSYRVTIAKMSAPVRQDGGQSLTRTQKEFSSNFLRECAEEISQYREALEKIRIVVFRSGEGWPAYLVVPEGDPLNLKSPATLMQIISDQLRGRMQ